MFAGWASDRFGRKNVLILTAILFAVSAVGAAFNLSGNESSLTARIGVDSGREQGAFLEAAVVVQIFEDHDVVAAFAPQARAVGR